MTDFSKVKSLLHPLGRVKAIHRAADGTLLWESGYENEGKDSVEADGETVYNGALGYKNGYGNPVSGASLIVTKNEEIV